jgi:CubicO group peptidase (beta-lactamase class C family)
MIKNLLKISLVLLFNIPLFSQNSDSDKEITSYLDQLTDKDFSGTILVAKNDDIIEQRAFDMANKEFRIKNKIDTKFNIASITKSFTAAAILQLYDEGKLDLHKPIGNYLSEYPNEEVKKSVTIHHLLTHTAGTKAIYGENYQITDKTRYKQVKDYLPLFANDTLLFPPGSKYEYNGGGFVILALIIESVSGEDYYSYLNNHIFSPLRMENTSALEIDDVVENKADGYSIHLKEDKSFAHNYYHLSKASGASGYYSTVEDLFLFSQALKNYKLLSEKSTKLMFEPKVDGYNTKLGYGIDIDLRYNQPILGHNGGWYGINAEWMIFDKSGYTIILLSNLDNNGKTEVSDFFKTLIAGEMKKE